MLMREFRKVFFFKVAENQGLFDALMFVVCDGSNPEHDPKVHHKQD
jgi:hypothetical protein